MIPDGDARVDRAVSRLFAFGTKGATGMVAAGCVGRWAMPRAALALDLCRIGIAIFVLLPVAGALMMAVLYLRQGRRLLGATAVAVLLVTAAGSLLAAMMGR
jgi:hypothetical protein